jgi:hypothetical protein
LEKPYERKKTFTNGWYGPGKSLYPSPLIRPVEYLLPVRKISFAIKNSRFCNSGQALRAE